MFCVVNIFIYILQVTSFQGPEELNDALIGCDIVLIPAGVPRKPGKVWLRFIYKYNNYIA